MTRLVPLLLALLALAVAPADALAQAFATVESIQAQDEAGRWRKVDTSPDAVLLGASETPLAVGMTLDPGAQVRTGLARVVIVMEPKNRVEVHEGGQLVLQERGVLQELGDVYYKVRGAFSVQFGTVEATVEGTTFEVHGPSPVWVGVVRGKVRVTAPGGEVLLRRNHKVTVGEDGGLTTTDQWEYCAECGKRHEPL